ncbi:hypothetical protein K2173_010147 (mitochondrion) [Erythroxylum novogranatense]|uniref:Uncharacterized protein n=1 Tax=Erythroxylum novogranatense TaxID=1862640 RepID=A0AAV8S433_9ROSI|nr:hypothetical protein K2173_010147 [Erythroxylum novogranatense]
MRSISLGARCRKRVDLALYVDVETSQHQFPPREGLALANWIRERECRTNLSIGKPALPAGRVAASSLSFSRFRYRILSLGERCRSSPLTQGGLPPFRCGRGSLVVKEVMKGKPRAAFVVACCAESNLLRFFSVAEKRSLPPAFKNDEYEVREAAGTMDPLTPNRVAFPGLAGVACRS